MVLYDRAIWVLYVNFVSWNLDHVAAWDSSRACLALSKNTYCAILSSKPYNPVTVQEFCSKSGRTSPTVFRKNIDLADQPIKQAGTVVLRDFLGCRQKTAFSLRYNKGR